MLSPDWSWSGLALEGALAVLLVVVAVLGWRLDRRLSALRSGADGVRTAVEELNAATARAETAIRLLQDMRAGVISGTVTSPADTARLVEERGGAARSVRGRAG